MNEGSAAPLEETNVARAPTPANADAEQTAGEQSKQRPRVAAPHKQINLLIPWKP